MLIKKFSVEKLHGRLSCELDFHDDLNVLTGKNGCGKTTVLKLIWYMMSGNLERIFKEMRFRSAKLTTDQYEVAIHTQEMRDIETAEYSFRRNNSQKPTKMSCKIGSEDENYLLERMNQRIANSNQRIANSNHQRSSSLFFPTFRRIEGGFSINAVDNSPYAAIGLSAPIASAFIGLARLLSVGEHRFVSSTSTMDIIELATNRFAEISAKVNEENQKLSEVIKQHIEEYSLVEKNRGNAKSKLSKAIDVLDSVQKLNAENSERRKELLKPFDSLSRVIGKILKHKGIALTSTLTLGEASNAIASDKLSAGEKQMLSFLAYNALVTNSVIFIDEPEISLHADWQRLLFTTLLKQGTNNQFIISTHSPFIYTKYSDKELILDKDKGDQDAQDNDQSLL